MKSFIEELYYGNIDPQNSGFEEDEAVQRTMQTIRENEDFLADTLTGEEKERFLDFADAWSACDDAESPRKRIDYPLFLRFIQSGKSFS